MNGGGIGGGGGEKIGSRNGGGEGGGEGIKRGDKDDQKALLSKNAQITVMSGIRKGI